MPNSRLRFQKGDMAAIAAVLLVAVLVFWHFLPSSDTTSAYAEIYHRGELVQTLSLRHPCEFTLEKEYSNTITVRDGKIAVTKSNCPGIDCVHCGWIGSSGRSIVCLPNGLEIRVVSDNNEVDFVVG